MISRLVRPKVAANSASVKWKPLGLGHFQPTAVMGVIRVDQHAVHVEDHGLRVVRGGQRQFHGDVGSLAGRRLDGHAAFQQPHALADALQSESLLFDGVRVEADPQSRTSMQMRPSCRVNATRILSLRLCRQALFSDS